MIVIIYHECRNSDIVEMALVNCFTPEGLEEIKKEVRERNSTQDKTELELLI